jgi:hypothetical protein
MSNVIEPFNKLEFGKKYHNNSKVFVKNIQEPAESTNKDISNSEYSIIAGKLNGIYHGTNIRGYVFQLLDKTILTGQPEIILEIGTSITLTDDSSKPENFVLNTKIIDENSNPTIEKVVNTGLITGINQLSNITNSLQNPLSNSVLKPPEPPGGGKPYKKNKTKKRNSKRRYSKKPKTKKRQMKKQKSKRRK